MKLKPAAVLLIIGGGNSAMDAARAAKELDNNNEVIVSCIESRQEMPAFEDEIEDTINRGINIIDNSYAENIISGNGNLSVTLKTYDNKKAVTESSLHFTGNETKSFDYIITATGQEGEVSALDGDLQFDESNRIKSIYPNKNVFASGDISADNHISLIGAIGSGKKAAVDVRKLLEGYQFDYEGQFALQKLGQATNNNNLRLNLDTGNLDFEILSNYDLYQPCSKCNHCIDNFGCPAMIKVDGKVIIDDILCTRCGLCIDVCPNNAIEIFEENLTESNGLFKIVSALEV